MKSIAPSRFFASMCLMAGLCCVSLLQAETAPKKAKAPDPAFNPVVDDPALPRVLLIGDSISIGYTVPVQKALAGKANVHRIPENGGPTSRGVEKIDMWLGDGKWDVIHFNFGLHDLKEVNGKPHQVPIDEYEANLTKIVDRLQKTNAKLIWRNTTPVPPGTPQRVTGDEVKYNAVAEKIMKERGIPIDDHYGLVTSRSKELTRKKNVHYTAEGSQVLGEKAAAAIAEQLPKSKSAPTP